MSDNESGGDNGEWGIAKEPQPKVAFSRNWTCVVCSKGGSKAPQGYKGKKFHAECIAAMRSRRRQMKGDKRLLKLDDDLFRTNIKEWAKELQTFIDPATRSEAVREQKARTERFREEMETKENNVIKKKCV